jgi:repressor LexA
MVRLTKRQERILEVIRESVATRGYPPSIREIGERVGLASPSNVHSHLAQLEEKGLITRDPAKPRAILVRAPGSTAPPAHPRKLLAEIPVLRGRTAGGAPALADGRVEDVIPLPRDWVGHGELYMLEVGDDSMIEAGLLDGDWVVIRSQPDADDGDMVLAVVDGALTVKHLSVTGDRLELLPAHPAYEPTVLDLAVPGNRILGTVVASVRRYGPT